MFVLFSLFFFKQKTAYEMRISDWSSDVCSSDLVWRCIPRCAAAMNAVAQSPQTSADERIAAALVARGRLKDADLGRARKLLAESDDSLTGLLGRPGLVSERDLADAVSEVLALPLVAARDCPDAPPPSIQLSTRFLKEHAICPVGEGEGALVSAASGTLLTTLEPLDPLYIHFSQYSPNLLLGRASSRER